MDANVVAVQRVVDSVHTLAADLLQKRCLEVLVARVVDVLRTALLRASGKDRDGEGVRNVGDPAESVETAVLQGGQAQTPEHDARGENDVKGLFPVHRAVQEELARDDEEENRGQDAVQQVQRDGFCEGRDVVRVERTDKHENVEDAAVQRGRASSPFKNPFLSISSSCPLVTERLACVKHRTTVHGSPKTTEMAWSVFVESAHPACISPMVTAPSVKAQMTRWIQWQSLPLAARVSTRRDPESGKVMKYTMRQKMVKPHRKSPRGS